MSKTDKIEIPEVFLDKLNMMKIKLKDNQFVVLSENNNGSISKCFFNKIKKIFNDYTMFLKYFLQKKINLIEIIYLIRPLIYLGLMLVFKKKSMIPLIINFILDIMILKINRHFEDFDQQKTYYFEYMYRFGRLIIYFLREPIYSIITKPFIRKIMKILRFPSFLCELLMALLSYYSNLYFIL